MQLSHIFSPKATQLHYSLKKLENIIRTVKYSIKVGQNIPAHFNLAIAQLNNQHKLEIFPLTPTTAWISEANFEWKKLYHTRNLENIRQTRQQITEAITKRCTKLQTSPTSILNSILNRHKDPVKFNNIKLNQKIITDPSDIKSHIQQHFNNWTALRSINQSLFNSDWQTEYDPKPYIHQE